MLGELLDAVGQDGDLNLGVAGVDRGVLTNWAVSSACASLETVIVSPFVLRRPRATRFGLGLGSRRWSEQPRSRYQQVGMLPQAARACASSPTQHEFHRAEALIGVHRSPNMRKPEQEYRICGSIRSAMSASKVMDMRARSHAVSPVDTSSAPGTLDAHNPHMRPPPGLKIRQHGVSAQHAGPKNRVDSQRATAA